MYDLAQRLSQELHTPSLLEKRCRTLSVVYETLKLADFGKDVIFCEVDEVIYCCNASTLKVLIPLF